MFYYIHYVVHRANNITTFYIQITLLAMTSVLLPEDISLLDALASCAMNESIDIDIEIDFSMKKNPSFFLFRTKKNNNWRPG